MTLVPDTALVPRGTAEARARGLRPLLQANGFIELDLDRDHQLHFWVSPLSDEIAVRPLHDHTYDFVAEILLGCFVSVSYAMPSSAPRADPGRGGAAHYFAGDTYTMRAGEFHDAYGLASPTVVLLRKTRHDVTAGPRLVYLKDGAVREAPTDSATVPACGEDRLWELVDSALKRCSR